MTIVLRRTLPAGQWGFFGLFNDSEGTEEFQAQAEALPWPVSPEESALNGASPYL